MKKIISVICIVALLVTSLGVTFMNVAAAPVTDYQDGDTVTLAKFTDDEGNDWYPYGPSDAPIPESVISTGTASIVENTTGLPLTGLFSIPTKQAGTTANINFDWMSLEGTNGIMLYVEVPENVESYDLYLKLAVYNKSVNGLGYAYRSYSNGMYYRALTAATFTQESKYGTYTNGKLTLTGGFKGYVYYNFKNMTTNSSGYTDKDTGAAVSVPSDDTISEEDSIRGIRIDFSAVEGEDLVVSTPMLIKGTFNTTNTAPTDTITVGGLTYKLDGTGLVDDGSNYVKPNFTGLTTATVSGLTSTVIGGGSHTNYATTNSVTPLNTAESVSFTSANRAVGNGADASGNKVGTFNFTNGVTMSADNGFMFYIDVSANTSTTAPVLMMIKTYTNENAGGSNNGLYGWSCKATSTGPKVYILNDDGTEETVWTEQELPNKREVADWPNVYNNREANSGVLLPAGFKGYIYIPSNCFQSYATYKSMVVWMSGTASGKKYYISAPMFVSSFDASSTIVNGDACVLDLDTNEKISADYTGSDTFYGDASQLYVHSAPTIKPATLAKDNVYHPLSSLNKIDGSDGVFSVGNSSMRPNMSVSVNNKIVPIMDIPAFEVATNDAFTTSSGAWVSYNTSIDITANSGIVLYVKNHNDVAKNLSIPNIKIPANNTENPYPFSGTSQYRPYRSNNDNYIKMLDVNNDEYWQSVDVSGTYFTLPANFEGYLYFAFEGFDGILALLNDTTTYAEYLKVTSFSLSDSSMAAGQTMTVSLPMLATDFSASGYVSPVAYVNDAVAPQNIITDKFALPYDHNGDMKVDILDLVRAKEEGTADYASMRKNYLNIAVDAQAVLSNPS